MLVCAACSIWVFVLSSCLIIISVLFCLPFLQSQVYRSQPDLVSAVYDATASTLAVDYSYGQYPNAADASQNYSQYLYPSEYTANSTWVAPEQRKQTVLRPFACSVMYSHHLLHVCLSWKRHPTSLALPEVIFGRGNSSLIDSRV